jgi:hypothetical protein
MFQTLCVFNPLTYSYLGFNTVGYAPVVPECGDDVEWVSATRSARLQYIVI